MSKYLLWADLESTGLSITEDEVLEAAFILTDTDLNELGRVEAVLEPGPRGLKRLMGNPVVRKMHTDNGLIAAVLSGPTCSLLEVEQRALDLLANNEVTKDDVLHLAGSGIAAFDRPIIRERMPSIDVLLHYAPIDVGVLKRTYEMWAGHPITTDEAGKAHRAMADVEGHLREARAFRELFKRVAPADEIENLRQQRDDARALVVKSRLFEDNECACIFENHPSGLCQALTEPELRAAGIRTDHSYGHDVGETCRACRDGEVMR